MGLLLFYALIIPFCLIPVVEIHQNILINELDSKRGKGISSDSPQCVLDLLGYFSQLKSGTLRKGKIEIM